MKITDPFILFLIVLAVWLVAYSCWKWRTSSKLPAAEQAQGPVPVKNKNRPYTHGELRQLVLTYKEGTEISTDFMHGVGYYSVGWDVEVGLLAKAFWENRPEEYDFKIKNHLGGFLNQMALNKKKALKEPLQHEATGQEKRAAARELKHNHARTLYGVGGMFQQEMIAHVVQRNILVMLSEEQFLHVGSLWPVYSPIPGGKLTGSDGYGLLIPIKETNFTPGEVFLTWPIESMTQEMVHAFSRVLNWSDDFEFRVYTSDGFTHIEADNGDKVLLLSDKTSYFNDGGKDSDSEGYCLGTRLVRHSGIKLETGLRFFHLSEKLLEWHIYNELKEV